MPIGAGRPPAGSRPRRYWAVSHDRLAIVPLDRDDAAIERVLAESGPQHRQLDAWIGRADAVHGAVIGGRLVGVAARYHSELHPVRDWLTVHVRRAHRRVGVGSMLHESITAAGPRSTKVRLPSSEEAGLGFAKAHGYAHLVRSAEVSLHRVPPPTGTSDVEVVAVGLDDDTFLDALARLYVASHRWDPCPFLPAHEVRRFLAGEDALPQTARIATRRREVVGVGVAYDGRTTNLIEMANLGAVDPEAEDGVEIAHVVLHAVSDRLLTAGATALVECDFGPGANTALADLLVRLDGKPSSTIEILATPQQ